MLWGRTPTEETIKELDIDPIVLNPNGALAKEQPDFLASMQQNIEDLRRAL